MHLVMFDIDGTLTATSEVDARCFSQAFSDRLGVNISTDWTTYRHVTHSGITAELVERHLGRRSRQDEILAIQQHYLGLLETALLNDPYACCEIPGAGRMLLEIRKRHNVAVALATGAWGNAAHLKLKYAGLRCDAIPLASADDAFTREDIFTMAYQRAAQGLSVQSFTSVTYVGDGVWDYAASNTLGFGFVGIASGDNRDSLLAAGAAAVIPDFLRLDDALSKMCGSRHEE